MRYVQLAHVGRSAARNCGLELARGRYIGFLDDDDLYHPDKLSHEIAFLQTNREVDIVGSGYRVVDKNGQVSLIYKRWQQSSEVTVTNCLFGVPLITCSVLITRGIIDRMDHWFDPAFDIGEDPDFFMRLILAGARFAWLKEILSDYRQIHAKDDTMMMDARRAYHRVLAKIVQIPHLPPEVIQQHQSALIAYDLRHAWWASANGLDKTPPPLFTPGFNTGATLGE